MWRWTTQEHTLKCAVKEIQEARRYSENCKSVYTVDFFLLIANRAGFIDIRAKGNLNCVLEIPVDSWTVGVNNPTIQYYLYIPVNHLGTSVCHQPSGGETSLPPPNLPARFVLHNNPILNNPSQFPVDVIRKPSRVVYPPTRDRKQPCRTRAPKSRGRCFRCTNQTDSIGPSLQPMPQA